MWGVYIVSFVFWVGIGHAGTLISAILYLFRAGFRTSIYRVSEAMTVFAVMTAGLFPILHLGRPWKFFYLMPYPNWRLIWPNPKSPLVWDVFAILTYLTVSATFLFVGLIPDFAVMRDREKNPIRKRLFATLSLGWRNSDGVAPLRARVPVPGRVRHAARAVRALGGVVRLRDGATCPAGTRRSSRRTSWPAPSSPASGWCSRSSSRCGSSSSSSTTSRSTTSTRRPSCACSRRWSWASRTSPSSRWRGSSGNELRAGVLLEPRVRPVVRGPRGSC